MKVLVASKEVASAEAQYSNEDFKEVYVGGIPDALRERWALAFLPAFTCFQSCFLTEAPAPPAETTSPCSRSEDA